MRVDAVDGELVRARVEPELLGGGTSGIPLPGDAVDELRALRRLRGH